MDLVTIIAVAGGAAGLGSLAGFMLGSWTTTNAHLRQGAAHIDALQQIVLSASDVAKMATGASSRVAGLERKARQTAPEQEEPESASDAELTRQAQLHLIDRGRT